MFSSFRSFLMQIIALPIRAVLLPFVILYLIARSYFVFWFFVSTWIGKFINPFEVFEFITRDMSYTRVYSVVNQVFPTVQRFVDGANELALDQSMMFTSVWMYTDYLVDRYLVNVFEREYEYKGISVGDGFSGFLREMGRGCTEGKGEGVVKGREEEKEKEKKEDKEEEKENEEEEKKGDKEDKEDTHIENKSSIRFKSPLQVDTSVNNQFQSDSIPFESPEPMNSSHSNPPSLVLTPFPKPYNNRKPSPVIKKKIDVLTKPLQPSLKENKEKESQKSLNDSIPLNDSKQPPITISHSLPTTFLKTNISPISNKIVSPIPNTTTNTKKSLKYKLRIKKKPTPQSHLPSQLPSPPSQAFFPQIKEEMYKIFNNPTHDDGTMAPIILRLAWHCCATYDKYTNTGGSNGATMRFEPEISDEGNNGLDIARKALEPIKQKYPISYADLWTLGGKLAIEYMGGPEIVWKGGRVDDLTGKCVPPNGRLPFGDKDSNHIKKTFERMGFDKREAVVLLGCHTVGRCHKEVSGWEGKWTEDPTMFSNDFYKVLLNEVWKLDKVPETGKLQYYNSNKMLMMLISDFELVNDLSLKRFVKHYSENNDAYFKDFAATFEKLLELGIERDEWGNVQH